ncbi:MAG TPA: hypothetical protein VMP01_13690, partial [Pirellulaceae bacterium]|nr:hypothetical protein [Pirellulaceae bacterium]
MAADDQFEILPAEEMRRRYGLTAENRPTIQLDPSKVPPSLHELVPLAERFGISDDLIREDVLRRSTGAELEAMKQAVSSREEALDVWLAGLESNGPTFSDEYIAFSCLRIA